MKKIFTLLIGIVLSISIINAQEAPPQAFSFKATIQGVNGQTVVNKTISLRISILQDDVNGFTTYSEFFTPTTNHYSQVDVEIGHGNVLSGIFSSIDWSAHKYFLKIEVDTKGGTNYQLVSVTQLLSVPYAMYAGEASSSTNESDPVFINSPAHLITTGEIGDWNDAFTWGNHSLAGYLKNEVDGSITNEIQTLSISENVISISNGNSITLPYSSSTGQYYYLDKDGDGYGNVFNPVWVPSGVTSPANFISNSSDCADDNPVIHPEATEICGDGIDQDCNGSDLECTTDIDSDNDGYAVSQGDCNDNDPTINPGATEICDGKDNDCDMETDEDCIVDMDGDGFTANNGDCNDNDANIHPFAVEIDGDGIDSNCDGNDNLVLPSSFDWRNANGQNWLSPIKSQGSCGSCFVFGPVAALEAKIKIHKADPNFNIDLSEQEIVSCDPTAGCDGGSPANTLIYIRDKGIVEESVFPYTSGNGTVPPCISVTGQKKYKIDSFETMYTDNPVEIKKALINKGPVIYITNVPNSLYQYNGGIYSPSGPIPEYMMTNTIVGYNDVESYWIIRNNWGNWGESGYYKISYSGLSFITHNKTKWVINNVVDN
jgi:C1A family cysteine protease